MEIIMNCSHCGHKFQTSKNQTGRQKYCSKHCRESAWSNRNPVRIKENRLKYNSSKTVKCFYAFCDNAVPQDRRNHGRTFCCDTCRDKHAEKMREEYISKLSTIFSNLKAGVGCQICGYNKYSGSLDFHHKDPNEKEGRITFRSVHSSQIEIAKCAMLCKNCHNEIHAIYRESADRYTAIMNGLSNLLSHPMFITYFAQDKE